MAEEFITEDQTQQPQLLMAGPNCKAPVDCLLYKEKQTRTQFYKGSEWPFRWSQLRFKEECEKRLCR